MIDDVVMSQWLFDQQQPVLVELRQVLSMIKRIDAIRVYLEHDVRPGCAHRTRRFDIPTRFDFQFNALIACIDIGTHDLQERIDVLLDADRHPDTDRLAYATKHRLEALLLGMPKPVPHRKFEPRLGDAIGTHIGKNALDVIRVSDVVLHQHRCKDITQHNHCRGSGFFVVPRSGADRTFAPACYPICIDTHQDGITACFTPATCFER